MKLWQTLTSTFVILTIVLLIFGIKYYLQVDSLKNEKEIYSYVDKLKLEDLKTLTNLLVNNLDYEEAVIILDKNNINYQILINPKNNNDTLKLTLNKFELVFVNDSIKKKLIDIREIPVY